MPYTIGIVLFPDSEELDWAGPWEVLTAGALEGDRIITVAESIAPVRCAKGLRVLPDRSFADCPQLDVLVVPGGVGSRAQRTNAATVDFVSRQHEATEWTTSVCTGSFILHAAGILEGRVATTHWAAFDEFLGFAPDQRLDAEARWVVDGKVVTAAGVSAGIDMALWLLGQLHGVDHARATQRYIQYDPAPPYEG